MLYTRLQPCQEEGVNIYHWGLLRLIKTESSFNTLSLPLCWNRPVFFLRLMRPSCQQKVLLIHRAALFWRVLPQSLCSDTLDRSERKQTCAPSASPTSEPLHSPSNTGWSPSCLHEIQNRKMVLLPLYRKKKKVANVSQPTRGKH